MVDFSLIHRNLERKRNAGDNREHAKMESCIHTSFTVSAIFTTQSMHLKVPRYSCRNLSNYNRPLAIFNQGQEQKAFPVFFLATKVLLVNPRDRESKLLD